MKESLNDYNQMFGTHYGLYAINTYNTNLNDRLAQKSRKYKDRKEQLDLVIVVNRLLIGFDTPCLSTFFIDRSPMQPQDLIQAFSRTKRIFDSGKTYGQIVTLQKPDEYKQAINDALILYSKGTLGDGDNYDEPIAEDWNNILESFKQAISSFH